MPDKLKTIDEVRPVLKKVEELIESRDEIYGRRWAEEPLSYLLDSILRKSSGLKYTMGLGVTSGEKVLEQVLDVMGYAVLLYVRLEKSS